MPRYLIYCDESVAHGRFYSDFYGGALVDISHRQSVEAVLNNAKGNCQGEMKWTKISEYNEKDYIAFCDAIFDLLALNALKIRVMFTQNMKVPPKHISDDNAKYFKLYYQFVKHAFGLRYCNPGGISNVYISLYLDRVPMPPAKFTEFKTYLSGLANLHDFRSQRLRLATQDIADVDSTQHVILQAVDVIVGAMQFRLNEAHKALPPGAKRRGNRTRAKERVYKHINQRIRELYPHFNIGASTGQSEGPHVRWTHPYRHWCFEATGSQTDRTRSKASRKKPPKG